MRELCCELLGAGSRYEGSAASSGLAARHSIYLRASGPVAITSATLAKKGLKNGQMDTPPQHSLLLVAILPLATVFREHGSTVTGR